MKHETKNPDAACGYWRSRYALGFVVIGAVAAYFLLTEHLAHVFFALPFLLLLACPLMHIFMHHGHGGHKHKESQNTTSEKSDKNGQEQS